MCGRYQQCMPDGHLQDVCPAMDTTVFTAAGSCRMRWGFHLHTGKRLLINARSEDIALRATFAPLLKQNRCLIPAQAFYEWNAQKQAFLFSRPGDEPLYLAGLYRREADGDHFVILTRAADAMLASVHPRMPVFFASDEYRALWLRCPTLGEALLSSSDSLPLEQKKAVPCDGKPLQLALDLQVYDL